MNAKPIEIVCAACGAEALLRREPVYEGLKKAGERLLCAACGHAYASEADVPFKQPKRVAVFTDADKPKAVEVFDESDKQRNCRYCRHYIVNPFTQWCGRHHKEVQATDGCPQFERKPDAPPPAEKKPGLPEDGAPAG